MLYTISSETAVVVRFTELTGNKRVVAQLKGQWRRMKVSAKKNIAHHKRAIKSTGGGEKPPSPSPEDHEIMAICPIDFIEDENDFDSDAINRIINKPSTSSTNVKNDNIIDSVEIQVISDSKISHENTPSMSSAIIQNEDIMDFTEVHMLSDSEISNENILQNSCIVELVDENSKNGSQNEQQQPRLVKDAVNLKENMPKITKRKKRQGNEKMLKKCPIKETILQSNKEYKEKLFQLQKKRNGLKNIIPRT